VIAAALGYTRIDNLTDEQWFEALNLKFMGYVRSIREVAPIMIRQGGGRILNLIGNDGNKPAYWEVVPSAANAAGHRPASLLVAVRNALFHRLSCARRVLGLGRLTPLGAVIGDGCSFDRHGRLLSWAERDVLRGTVSSATSPMVTRAGLGHFRYAAVGVSQPSALPACGVGRTHLSRDCEGGSEPMRHWLSRHSRKLRPWPAHGMTPRNLPTRSRR